MVFLLKKCVVDKNLREPAKILTELAVKFYSGQSFRSLRVN